MGVATAMAAMVAAEVITTDSIAGCGLGIDRKGGFMTGRSIGTVIPVRGTNGISNVLMPTIEITAIKVPEIP